MRIYAEIVACVLLPSAFFKLTSIQFFMSVKVEFYERLSFFVTIGELRCNSATLFILPVVLLPSLAVIAAGNNSAVRR